MEDETIVMTALAAGIAMLLFAGAIVLAASDGVRNGFGFWKFFAHFYPEVKGVVGPQLFGYNKKTHALHFALYVLISAVMAGVCMMFCP